MVIRSRIVLPVCQPPIQDGVVRIRANRIVELGPFKDLSLSTSEPVVDLGDSVLLPGLINAHCHLDYTEMAGTVPPQKSFTDWIPLMLAAKAEWNYSEFATSWLRGADMLLRSGTTTVADIEAVPELLPDVWQSTPLRVLSLIEMTGVKTRRDPKTILREALDCTDRLPGGRCRPGLSPHAPYSTNPELLRLSAETVIKRHWPMAVHVSESADEFAMFTRAEGDMFDWLRRNGRNMSDCGIGSPIQHLERNGALGSHLLAVHVNYLAPKDSALLARRKVSVVHCPRSHVYFRHAPFPFARLTQSKVNVCLGTDSLATVYKMRKQAVALNMFDEMHAFARANPRVPPKTILRMATMNGARALGFAGETGEISRGALADMIAVPYSGKIDDVEDAVLEHEGAVSASMIDGDWAIGP